MNSPGPKRRSALIRESLIFQLKLLADGTRDFMLVPISLVATLVGLARGGSDPDREFQRVMDLGRKSDRWINLFGDHEPIAEAGKAGSIDMMLTQAEEVVRDQARKGGISDQASQAIQRALDAAHEKARSAARQRDSDQP
ncbi:MAG: hypothetical protein R3348_00200 [Xanthomonadales bacterium]|nr:hypothetical protein [Xanthomonadales bacterium]